MRWIAVAGLSLAVAGPVSAATTVYEGVSPEGKHVKLTINDSGPEVVIRVDRQPDLPKPHWTALIGTGTAATSAER